MEGRPLARLRGEEVAPLLARQAGDDDAADAHRPGAGQRLGVDPRADDEDRAGQPDIEAAGAELAVARGGDVEPAAGRTTEGHDARHGAARGPDGDRRAGPDLADDARDRRLERLGHLAGRDAPAAAPVEEELARRDADAAGRVRARPVSGAVAEAGVAQPLGDRRPGDDRFARRHERPVARRESAATDDRPGRSTRRRSRRRARDRLASGRAGDRLGHPSAPGPEGRLPRREQVAPAVGAVGQPQRHVAQVDEQAAQAAGDVDREVPAARRRGGPCRGT